MAELEKQILGFAKDDRKKNKGKNEGCMGGAA
jgi:hypothetical protein